MAYTCNNKNNYYSFQVLQDVEAANVTALNITACPPSPARPTENVEMVEVALSNPTV